MSNAAFEEFKDAHGTTIEVAPADAPKSLLFVAAAVAVFVFGFSGVPLVLTFPAIFVCLMLGLADTRPLVHKTSALFRVRPGAIEALGETFGKPDIDSLAVENGHEGGGTLLERLGAYAARLQQTKFDNATKSLRLRSRGRSIVLAGGLDPGTASSLLAAVKATLAGAPSPEAESTGRPVLTVARAAAGMIGVDVRGFTGQVVSDESGSQWFLIDAGGRRVEVTYERKSLEMLRGEHISVFWGARRGTGAHVIDGQDQAVGKVKRGAMTWGTISDILAVVNHSDGGQMKIVPQPFNRTIIPSRKLYNFMGIVAIFGGLFGLMALVSGSLAGSVFAAFGIGFFVWISKRQRGLKNAIKEAAEKMKPQPAVSGFSR